MSLACSDVEQADASVLTTDNKLKRVQSIVDHIGVLEKPRTLHPSIARLLLPTRKLPREGLEAKLTGYSICSRGSRT